VTRRQGRRYKKLLHDLKDRRGYCELKEEALDRTMRRNRFARGFGPVVWQITDDDDRGILAGIQTAKFRPTLALVREVVNLVARGNALTTGTYLLPLYDVHTQTPVVCVIRYWEYWCDPTTYYTHRRCMVNLYDSLHHMHWHILILTAIL
jgi:hypothetical protein